MSQQTFTTSGKRPRLLINRNFALLWFGQVISFTGDFVFDTTLVLWVATGIAKGQPWAPLAVSLVLLVAALPMVIAAPIAGVLVDSWDDKRKTLLWIQGLSVVLILLLFPMAGLVRLPFLTLGQLPVFWRLGAIYSVTLLVGILANFFSPSEMALLSDIVEEGDRTRATGLHSLMLNLASLLAPSLGALLYFGVGVQWALLLNALSFVVAFLAILTIRVSRKMDSERELQQPGNFRQEFAEGIHFFGASRILVTLVFTGILLELISGVRNTLNIFFLTQNLQAPESFYGLLGSAFGGGLIAGVALASALAPRIGLTRTYWLSAIANGILVLVYARLTSLAPALVTLFMQGLISGISEVSMISLVMQISPRNFLGRVLAVFSSANGLALVLATALAGYLDSTLLHGFHAMLSGIAFRPIDTIFAAIGIIALVGGLYAMVTLRAATTWCRRSGSDAVSHGNSRRER